MPFRMGALAEGAAVAACADLLLYWQMPQILRWHGRIAEFLLEMAEVPWEAGREITLLPGVTAELLRTSYLDYQDHPLYPWYFLGAVVLLFVGYRWWPAPLKAVLLLLQASLAVTFLCQQLFSLNVPYSPEDFCATWIRGETYLWLLLPLLFALGYFLLSVPFWMKLSWLCLLVSYSFLWSAVRLAMALATFHYFGSLWMPPFYFVFGFLADFLYIVAFYSLAMDRAAGFLGQHKEVWQ